MHQAYTDTRVIAQMDQHQVLAQRHEIMFKDGSAVVLHPVTVDGIVQPSLRALHQEGLCWVVFDLRRLHDEFSRGWLHGRPAETHAIVFVTLRAIYRRAAEFAVAAHMHGQLSWWQMPHVPRHADAA